MYSLYLRYIISYIVNNNAKTAIFSPKVSMITNVILILCNSSINKKLIKRLTVRHHISCFCSISPTKIVPNTATALFCVSEQHESDSFLNELTV